jgi:alpha-glucosidase
MYKRRVFSLDPQYFPLNRMQEIVSYLHDHDQHYGELPSPPRIPRVVLRLC